MQKLRGLLVFGGLVFASLTYGQGAQELIEVEESSVHTLKVRLSKSFLGGDYFLTDKKGVMIAIGKVNNSEIVYHPTPNDDREMIFNAVSQTKNQTAFKKLRLR